MRNHDQKAKDMAESVLPSTMRDSARDRRAIHSRHRSRQRVQLRKLETGAQSGQPGDADVNLDEQGRFGNLKQNLTTHWKVQDR